MQEFGTEPGIELDAQVVAYAESRGARLDVAVPGVGTFMARSKVEQYRHHAQECLRLGDMMTIPERRAILVSMARTWHQLAQVHEQAEQPEEGASQSLIDAS